MVSKGNLDIQPTSAKATAGRQGISKEKANNEPQNIEFRPEKWLCHLGLKMSKEKTRPGNFGVRHSDFDIRYSFFIGER